MKAHQFRKAMDLPPNRERCQHCRCIRRWHSRGLWEYWDTVWTFKKPPCL